MSTQHFRKAPRADAPTGEQLAAELRAAATARSIPLYELLLPLVNPSVHPSCYLQQLQAAKCPRQHTVDRIRALIDGRAIPPPPHRRASRSPRCGTVTHVERVAAAHEEMGAAARHANALRLTTRHPLPIQREMTDHEKLCSASALIRFAQAEWPDVAAEVLCFAQETEISLGDAWRSVITAGLQCLRESD